MNLTIYIVLVTSCFILAILNGFFQNRQKTSGLVFCIAAPLAFLLFAIISGLVSSSNDVLYISICTAIAFYLATESCATQSNMDSKILIGIFHIASLIMLVFGSVSLAPFSIYGLLGGFLLGAGFAFTVFIVCQDVSIDKKIVCFVELIFSGTILGCSISSIALGTHIVSSALYLVGAILIFARYLLRTYFSHVGIFRIITKIMLGLAMISIISSIFFY